MKPYIWLFVTGMIITGAALVAEQPAIAAVSVGTHAILLMLQAIIDHLVAIERKLDKK
jgi:hypothetical protein